MRFVDCVLAPLDLYALLEHNLDDLRLLFGQGTGQSIGRVRVSGGGDGGGIHQVISEQVHSLYRGNGATSTQL